MNMSGENATRVRPEGFSLLPDAIVSNEILPRLDLNSLCSLSCVSRYFHPLVSQSLPTLSSLDLSAFSPKRELFDVIVSRLRGLKCVTIDCLQFDGHSIISILGPDIRELNLLQCANLSTRVIQQIGVRCPNLRNLNLELAPWRSFHTLKEDLVKMLNQLLFLERLSIKLRGMEFDLFDLGSIDLNLFKSVKFLKLKPMNAEDFFLFLEKHRDARVISQELGSASITPIVASSCFTLRSLSLVLDIITDRLVTAITSSLPFLVELDLKDRPYKEPKLPNDLTSTGLQLLGSCQLLTSLSIMRSKVNGFVSFKTVNDVGLFLLSQSCSRLESVRLAGFSVVTDAGFSSILRACCKLKKFEVFDAPLLSDLAFNHVAGPLIDLKLSSCNLITSEALAEFASSSTLEVIDTNGCRSIADSSLNYISCIKTLNSINLSGADITDRGLGVLSKGDLPIVKLCLRGCARITDRGIICLLDDGRRMRKTLSHLDIGHMPGISDEAVIAAVSNAESITELCLRYCFHVTDISIKALASKSSDGRILLQKLDICKCTRLSVGILELFQRPLFRGLRWIGVGSTSLVSKKKDWMDDLEAISQTRPWLTICTGGCELGCRDGWEFHSC